MNPYADNDRDWSGGEIVGLEGATVITAPDHSSGDNVNHAIEVKPYTFDEPTPADVRVDQRGDVLIPTEGSRVIIGYRVNGRPLVLGSRYSSDDTIPDYQAGERVIGHPLTNSHVRLAADGTIHVEGDGGNTVELQPNGDVVINGGATLPVTDVDFTNETVTRADGVYLPSQ